ncbi:hypothetical protein EX30DRAFT_366883 [Ascodesmis nigricans]|uniref:Rhodopsin domain-containing protein n=1 Tax=Ascodesmis nigricans TaxID=341454 RepID=A0A4S2MR34_9PEZI|nr:hypothetical protein EX30DRAFT_366883 [Ascodesmis nigricans]
MSSSESNTLPTTTAPSAPSPSIMMSSTATTTTTRTPFIPPTGTAAILAILRNEAEGIHLSLPPSTLHRFTTPRPSTNPESRGLQMLLLAIIPTVVAAIFVVLRLWMRVRKKRGPVAADDVLITVAVGLGTVCAGVTVYGVQKAGIGKHSWTLEYEEIDKVLLVVYLHLMTYSLSVAFIKFSIIFFVRRISGPLRSRPLNWIIWGNFWYMVLFQIALSFLYSFQCMPAGATWSLAMRFHPQTECINYLPLYYVGATLHAASDLTLLLAPILLILTLHLPLPKKLLVIFLLSLGILACICSLIRMVYILQYTRSWDLTWELFEPSIWGHLEIALAVIASCSPALRPLFARLVPGLGRGRRGEEREGEIRVTRRIVWEGGKGGRVGTDTVIWGMREGSERGLVEEGVEMVGDREVWDGVKGGRKREVWEEEEIGGRNGGGG